LCDDGVVTDLSVVIHELFGLSPGFLLLTALVGFFGFVVSAAFGIGGVVLLIPLLSMALPPAQAIAVSAPVMLVNDRKMLSFMSHERLDDLVETLKGQG
jgi:uncharacterized membrane protein YfcA